MSDGSDLTDEEREEVAGNINNVFTWWGRLFSIINSIIIFVLTGILVGIYATWPKADALSKTPLFKGVVVMFGLGNLLAFYWIITAFKPKYSIIRILSDDKKYSSDQIGLLLASIFMTGFWIFMAATSAELSMLLIFGLVTCITDYFTYQVWFKDLDATQQSLLGEKNN